MAKRRGVIAGIPVMFLVMLAVVAAVIIISQGIVVKVGLELPTILTDMPTFYDYAEDGSRAYEPIACDRTGSYNVADCVLFTPGCDGTGASTDSNCHLKPSVFIDYYWLLAGIGASVMMIALCISVLQYVGEGTGLTNASKAIENVKKIIPYTIFIFLLPTVWDPFAMIIEETALFFMAPFPPETDPYIDVGVVAAFVGGPQDSFKSHAQLRGAWLFMEAGSIVPPTVWQPETLVNFIFDPDDAVNNVLTGAFLGVFKAYVVIMLGLEMWVSGIVRVMATMITVMAMPIMLPLSLISQFQKATQQITSALAGLMIAPIFSAIVFTIGLAYLSSSRNEDELVRWLQAVCVCFLCSAAVTTLAGGFFMQAEGKVSAALKTALIAAAATVSAAATGGISAVGGMGAAAAGIGGGLGGAAKMGGGGAQNTMGANATALLGGSGSDMGSKSGTAAHILSGVGTTAAGAVGAITGGHKMSGGYSEAHSVKAGMGQTASTESGGDTPSVDPKQADAKVPPRAGGTVVTDGGAGELPEEAENKEGKTVKKPEKLHTAKPSKMDYFKTFLMGAVAGGVGPMMQGAIPRDAGMDKFTEPVKKKATETSTAYVNARQKEYQDSSDYFGAVNDQKEADKVAKKNVEKSEEDIKNNDKDGDSDKGTPSYIG